MQRGLNATELVSARVLALRLALPLLLPLFFALAVPYSLFPALLHFLPRAIAVPRNNVVLQRLVLLILQAQRLAFVIHQLHANLALRSVLLGVRRMVHQLVL